MNLIPLDDPIEQPPVTSDIDAYLDHLSVIRRAKAEAKSRVDHWESEEEILKASLMTHMKSIGATTGKAHGLQAQIKRRTTSVITDRQALVEALIATEAYENLLKLDATAAKNHGVEHGLPGVEKVQLEYLAIAPVKGGVA